MIGFKVKFARGVDMHLRLGSIAIAMIPVNGHSSLTPLSTTPASYVPMVRVLVMILAHTQIVTGGGIVPKTLEQACSVLAI
jgi:hypothetical protein